MPPSRQPYGWPADIAADDVLGELLTLNGEPLKDARRRRGNMEFVLTWATISKPLQQRPT